MKVRDLIRLIEADRWFLVRTTGSHRQFHHLDKPGTVTIAGNSGERSRRKPWRVFYAKHGSAGKTRCAIHGYFRKI
jgi:predicted RNA binding protein YcfA (HicA-like mRNA interferase family)